MRQPSAEWAAEDTRPAGVPLDGPAAMALLDALPAAVFITDGAGRITFANLAARAFWAGAAPATIDELVAGTEFLREDGSAFPTRRLPFVRAAAEGGHSGAVTLVVRRREGGSTRVAIASAPLGGGPEGPAGTITTLTDLGIGTVADEAAARLAAIVESSDDAIMSKDFDGIIRSWNTGAQRLFGYEPDEIIGRPVTVLIPEDRLDEEPAILARIRGGERVEHYETVRRCKDGSEVEISLSISPVRTADGRIVGASKIARDITVRRRAEERQRLLLREMNHRVKNLFAVAAGVVVLSARSSASTADMAEAVRNRLLALTRAHELTAPEITDEGTAVERYATLDDLLATIFAPYAEDDRADRGRFEFSGPPIGIGGAAVSSVALVLHEFATNSAKYGALLTPNGRIRVEWHAEGERVILRWSERGGPPIKGSPEAHGFGSVLVGRTVTLSLGGTLEYGWLPDGIDIRLDLPRHRLTEGTPTGKY